MYIVYWYYVRFILNKPILRHLLLYITCTYIDLVLLTINYDYMSHFPSVLYLLTKIMSDGIMSDGSNFCQIFQNCDITEKYLLPFMMQILWMYRIII